MTIETVQDLRDLLDEFDPETPVSVAQQPSWPLAAVPVAVTELGGRVWLATAEATVDGSPYAPSEAWQA